MAISTPITTETPALRLKPQGSLPFDRGSRDMAARELERLDLPKAERSILAAIFDRLWPATEPIGKAGQVITIAELHELTGLSKGTISPKLQLLAARRVVTLEKCGKHLAFSINWTELYKTTEERAAELAASIGQVDRLDRSSIGQNLDRSTGDRLDRSNLTGQNLDRSDVPELDRSRPMAEHIGPIETDPPLDAFTPAERLANAVEALVSLERERLLQEAETQRLLRQILDRLDRSSAMNATDLTGPKIDRSKQSPPLIKDSSLNTDLNTSIKAEPATSPDTAGPVKPIAAKPVPVRADGKLDWKAPRQLTAEDLRNDAFILSTLEDLCVNYGWPSTQDGLFDLVALAEFALKRPEANPAGAFVGGIQNRKFGPNKTTDTIAVERTEARLDRMRRPVPPSPSRDSPAATLQRVTQERTIPTRDCTREPLPTSQIVNAVLNRAGQPYRGRQ